MRRSCRTIASLAGAAVALLLPSSAHAYTWMLKHHYAACATCHVDPSGGELLTPYGRAQGELLLRTRYGESASLGAGSAKGEADTGVESFDSFDSFDAPTEPTAATAAEAPEQSSAAPATATPEGESKAAVDAGAPVDTDADSEGPGAFLWGVPTPDWLALGGSLRLAGLSRPRGDAAPRVFPMQADLYGALFLGPVQLAGSLGFSRVPASSPYARPAQLSTEQGEAANVLSRTHWVGYAINDQWLLRAGRLNLPFGLRIPEHVMWVRSETQTDRESDQQHGVALAYTGSVWRGELMAIAGNFQVNPDRYRERGYSGFAELLLLDSLGVGASSLVTRADADLQQDVEEATLRQAHGLFARWTPTSALTLLTEFDVLLRTDRQPGYAGMLQGDLEALRGLHLLSSLELLDAGYRPDPQWFLERRRPGNGAPRAAAWVGAQWFFFSHLDLRIDARYRQPQVSDQVDGSIDLLAQLHAYL